MKHQFLRKNVKLQLVTPAGFKPTTFGTGIRRSIQLNYGA